MECWFRIPQATVETGPERPQDRSSGPPSTWVDRGRVHPDQSRPQKGREEVRTSTATTSPRAGRSIRSKPARKRPMPHVVDEYEEVDESGRVWHVVRYGAAKPEQPGATRARWWPHRIPTRGQRRGS